MLVIVHRRTRDRQISLYFMQIVSMMLVRMTVHQATLVPVQMKVPMVRVTASFFTSELAQRRNRNPPAEKYERTARNISKRRA